MNPLVVSILRLDHDLPVPNYAVEGDAGMDIRSRVDVVLPPSGGRSVVPAGFAVALPPGFAALVLPRSGLAAKFGVTVLNAPGLIDSGYRGEVMVPLLNTDPIQPFSIARGDRIAQLMIMPVPTVVFSEVDSLPDSERGQGGFGHSGTA